MSTHSSYILHFHSNLLLNLPVSSNHDKTHHFRKPLVVPSHSLPNSRDWSLNIPYYKYSWNPQRLLGHPRPIQPYFPDTPHRSHIHFLTRLPPSRLVPTRPLHPPRALLRASLARPNPQLSALVRVNSPFLQRQPRPKRSQVGAILVNGN